MKKDSESKTEVIKTRAAILADEDFKCAERHSGCRFSHGTRPVIRWIKGNGLDDDITRAAIGQATRLFGNEVDYCLCTQGINASRVRSVLEWADQPVEWWPVSEIDNPELARFLMDAGCPPENFGYWWKWFPERVRPDAPEWILDGDMIITRKPVWYHKWLEGSDAIRLSQVDNEGPEIYGNYSSLVFTKLLLYSGLASLPPKCRYMPLLAEVLAEKPLADGHNGKKDIDEQGVIVAAFEKLNPLPIPLYEFPFCRAHQSFVDFGLKGNVGKVWGYHFGYSFIMKNPHFYRMTEEKIVFSKAESNLKERFQWLGNAGQWGIPGWSMPDGGIEIILDHAACFAGEEVLELGTSRGRLTAMLATLGCKVTTIDHQDRGARKNLEGLTATVVVDEAEHFLSFTKQYFDLIICDFHGNSPADWIKYARPLMKRIKSGTTLIINNLYLGRIPEWHEETGVEWFLKLLPEEWNVKLYGGFIPGIAVITNENRIEINKKIKLITDWFKRVSNKLNIHFIRKHLQIIGNTRIIKRSGFFNESYYLKNNPDVKQSGMNPAKHYLLYGGFEGRKPSEKFDSSFYLENNPDVKASGMNPLLHFIRFGKKENRKVRND